MEIVGAYRQGGDLGGEGQADAGVYLGRDFGEFARQAEQVGVEEHDATVCAVGQEEAERVEGGGFCQEGQHGGCREDVDGVVRPAQHPAGGIEGEDGGSPHDGGV